MSDYRTTRILPIALTLIMIAVVIAVAVSIVRIISFPNTTNTADFSRDALVNVAADRAVRMTVRGPIVASEEARSYQIQITSSNRKFTAYKGYIVSQIDNISLGNNVPSYEQFIYALDRANMMRGTEATGINNDLRGVCATGSLYEFQILQSDKDVKSLWTSTCSEARGSLDAKVKGLTQLFINQVPGSNNIINGLWR